MNKWKIFKRTIGEKLTRWAVALGYDLRKLEVTIEFHPVKETICADYLVGDWTRMTHCFWLNIDKNGQVRTSHRYIESEPNCNTFIPTGGKP